MASSKAKTVAEYLKELPPERRPAISQVRQVVRANPPPGCEETMNWGMISYEIPLSRYSGTCNTQPLGYVGLTAQKNNYALYLMGVYADGEQERVLREAFAAIGRKPDMGESCVRFKKIEDVPLDAVGRLIASMPVEDCIARYEAGRART